MFCNFCQVFLPLSLSSSLLYYALPVFVYIRGPVIALILSAWALRRPTEQDSLNKLTGLLWQRALFWLQDKRINTLRSPPSSLLGGGEGTRYRGTPEGTKQSLLKESLLSVFNFSVFFSVKRAPWFWVQGMCLHLFLSLLLILWNRQSDPSGPDTYFLVRTLGVVFPPKAPV